MRNVVNSICCDALSVYEGVRLPSYLALSVDAASALALFQKEEGSTLFLSHLNDER